MIKQGLWITGTDTNIGKTLTSALLVSALSQRGLDVGYFKPVQTGNDSDTETVTRLTVHSPAKKLAPVYCFPDPLAPSQAAARVGAIVDLERVVQTWRKIESGHWVLEGAGGLLVPLNRNETIRDLVKRLEIPVVLVASTRLGTINHTLLTLESLSHSDIPIAGIILNTTTTDGSASKFLDPELFEGTDRRRPGKVQDSRTLALVELCDTLRNFTSVPILAILPHLPEPTSEAVHQLAPKVFSKEILSCLYPGSHPHPHPHPHPHSILS